LIFLLRKRKLSQTTRGGGKPDVEVASTWHLSPNEKVSTARRNRSPKKEKLWLFDEKGNFYARHKKKAVVGGNKKGYADEGGGEPAARRLILSSAGEEIVCRKKDRIAQ